MRSGESADRSKEDRVDERSMREAGCDGFRFVGFRDYMPLVYGASDVLSALGSVGL